MKFIINGESLEALFDDWPEGSVFRLMYEGDKESEVFELNNPIMTKESIKLIIDVVTKNVTRKCVKNVDWHDLKYIVMYLGLGMSVDFIYPLLLTIEDRIEWYKDCETRRTYICRYDEKAEGKLTEVNRENMMKRDPNYNVIPTGSFINLKYRYMSLIRDLADDVIGSLSHIPRLFVAGGYSASKFNDFDQQWSDIDIFAYGPNALDHIKEGVKICLEMRGKNIDCNFPIPIRTQYSITVPIISGSSDLEFENTLVVQFILLESKSQFHILNRFDIDSTCIGFDISEPDKFLVLPRFIRAFETKSNITDPTRQSPTYVKRLIKYCKRGFAIAIPGYDEDESIISPRILKVLIKKTGVEKFKLIREMNLIGLQALLVSAMMKTNMSKSVSGHDYSSASCWGVKDMLVNVITSDIKSLNNTGVILGGQEVSFIIEDILNEGQREFIIGEKMEDYVLWPGRMISEIKVKNIKYIPKYLRIELMKDDPQDGMIGSVHQVKTSFY
uniref:Ankyrin repeat protein n=1 Tax=Pithovirus LCPAC403 TaxID=2506596 RepID=A0A481ZBL6_9VIRU|nr:MAG: ankyrin repeat protein [Pithovirus LCPAC403]